MYLRHQKLIPRYSMHDAELPKDKQPIIYDCPDCDRWIQRPWVTEKGHRVLRKDRQ